MKNSNNKLDHFEKIDLKNENMLTKKNLKDFNTAILNILQ